MLSLVCTCFGGNVKADTLKKELGLMHVFAIASGAMISSGLFILPGLAFAKAGPAVLLSYLLASLFYLPALLSQAELVTAMPKAGGSYFFIERAFGALFGTMGGISDWFAISLKSAFALLGIGYFATLLFPDLTPWQIKGISCACCTFFVLLNLKSVRHAGFIQVLLVFAMLAVLAIYSFAGVTRVSPGNYAPFVPFGITPILATAGMIFVSYGGVTKVITVAEEVKNPSRNIPLGMILSLIVVTACYLLVIFVTIGLVKRDTLAGSVVPISGGAEILFGAPGVIVLAAAAIMAFVTTGNAGILSASRIPMAMSRDRLMPDVLGRLSGSGNIPRYAILGTGLFIILSILFLNLEYLVKAASTLLILIFIFANLAVIIMREARIASYRPAFRAPLYPWMQIFGMLGCFFLIIEMGALQVLMAMLFLFLCFMWYWFYVRERTRPHSGLIYLIERIASREFGSESVGDELRRILQERDEIVEDRFDRLVKQAPALDVEGPLSMEELFRRIAGALTGKLGMSADMIAGMMIEREAEVSTVLADGRAVPHILVPGENVFELVIARCRKGVRFPGAKAPVYATFAFFGSKDQRNFHLKSLAAVAQVVHEEQFMKRWMDAREEKELRDIILLAERSRVGHENPKP
jgi:amino acid transporter/mannitol/fructose-specific phosphotransferase system IIA component (Ntr-type)